MGKRPKICLSLNCKNLEEIKAELDKYISYSDIIELCADKLEGIETMDKEEYLKLLFKVRFYTMSRRLIVDYKGDEEVKNRILRWSMGVANYIDVDYNDSIRDDLISEAKHRMTKVILSFHNFERMLDSEEVVVQYLRMEKTKADVLKIACMTNKKEDIYEILNGAKKYSSLRQARSIVAIAMGKLGEESRICMGDFGSRITYACGSKETAPGQFDAQTLNGYLNKYYEDN